MNGGGKALAHALTSSHRRLKGELLGKREKIGRVTIGTVYEQRMRAGGMTLRRVTVELNEHTKVQTVHSC